MLTAKTVTSILPAQTSRIYIAYSGGVDSHVLLHLCCSIEEIRTKITAVYIDHGLQVEAAQWATHCKSIALASAVNFKCIRINSQNSARQSPEEVARDTRYQALMTLLSEKDVLLVAQHREDQMETVLLQLFRGAGVQGLSAMPLVHSFGTGIICRPFLDISKQEIDDYAKIKKLHWIEDPSNKSDVFDRNFLRNKIIPDLKKRWPALDKTVARSARHCANSQAVLTDISQTLLETIIDSEELTLNIPRLLELDKNKLHLVIRQWFSEMQLRMPSENVLWRIINEVLLCKKTGTPEVEGKNYVIRRYQEKLFCLRPIQVENLNTEKQWLKTQSGFELGDERILALVEASEGISRYKWENSEVSVRFRKGAEKIRLPGRAGHHSLKNLFQEKSIPPWERNRVPLVYLNDVLAAVGSLWISADFFCQAQDGCYQFQINTKRS